MGEQITDQDLIQANYLRVEVSFAAIRREDWDVVMKDIETINRRYSRGGSAVNTAPVQEGTVLNRV